MSQKIDFGKIGVLMGGYSSEREISLKSGKAIVEALKRNNFDVVPLDIQDKQENQIKNFIKSANIDLAFIALHGQLGEDGGIQKILDELDISYTGSSKEANERAFNKNIAQELFKKSNLSVPANAIIRKGGDIAKAVKSLMPYPLIVKPAAEGSSIGINMVESDEQLLKALNEAWKFGAEALVEKFISGRELTVGILDQTPLAVIEICYSRPFFDYVAKYQSQETTYNIPAKISDELSKELQQVALKAFNALGCADLSRVDFRLDKNNQYYILEINTIPGFTSSSLLPKAAKYMGLDFDQLCRKLVELAYGKSKKTRKVSARS